MAMLPFDADPLTTPRVRLLGLDPAADATGAWNMAADEWLLARAVEVGEAALRFYLWGQPTVSLGHFQDAAEIPTELSALPAVRRLSGGGAIIHDRELTYSLALPVSHPLCNNPRQIYELAHTAIREALARLGAVIAVRGLTNADLAGRYLCFGRGDSFDLVVATATQPPYRELPGPWKIVGSAQRRRKGAVLQHGSILLAASAHAPEFPGLRELLGVDIAAGELALELMGPFHARLEEEAGLPVVVERFRPDEIELISRLRSNWGLTPVIPSTHQE
jgi:lipoate-protein ligase A